jgi:type III secretory pathway component EscR
MRKFLGALLLSGILMSPVVMRADDHDRRRTVRIYDRDRRDYHEWNENEERAYRHWVEQERKHAYRDWKHAGKKDQREYLRWRHEHSDWR